MFNWKGELSGQLTLVAVIILLYSFESKYVFVYTDIFTSDWLFIDIGIVYELNGVAIQ